jgi:hypothetical protein
MDRAAGLAQDFECFGVQKLDPDIFEDAHGRIMHPRHAFGRQGVGWTIVIFRQPPGGLINHGTAPACAVPGAPARAAAALRLGIWLGHGVLLRGALPQHIPSDEGHPVGLRRKLSFSNLEIGQIAQDAPVFMWRVENTGGVGELCSL